MKWEAIGILMALALFVSGFRLALRKMQREEQQRTSNGKDTLQNTPKIAETNNEKSGDEAI